MNNTLNCSVRRAPIVNLLLLAWLTCQLRVQANPTGGTVAQGTASFSTSGSQLTINQTSANAFINWQSFNIGAGETTTFVQPSSSSVAWNQINDANPSQILGTLNANGYVVLQNPNGFSIGGAAAISAHGLVMTTASTPTLNLSSGGAWSFNTPPPTAKIINYGQINITGGGSAFLIASDIENNGTISAPSGNIGLYAGQTVLVSMSPDGRGLSAEVTLPTGSVDNQGNLIADAGSIAAQAQTVNQGGLIQANSVQNINGTIELVASDSVNLESGSVISAQGASTGTSPGGSVTLQAGNTFSDQAGSAINVSGGAQGGNGGQLAISAPQMSALQSSINAQANAGYADGSLSINTANIVLNSDGSLVSGALALNVNSMSSGFSQINLQAAGNIELSSQWTLAAKSGIPGTVSLFAGNTITLDNGSGIEADAERITLSAATVNQNGTLQANSIGNVNGAVEIDASASLNLGASSVISANGDSTASSASPGGFVVLHSGNLFADTTGSTISVSGAAGGQNGIVEIFGNGVTIGSLQSSYGSPYALLINPNNLTLSTSATSTSSSSPNLNMSALLNYSQICLYNIELASVWNLGNASAPATLNLSAMNNIILDGSSGIKAGNNWNVNLTAGTGFVPTASQPAPASGNDGIYLNGGSYIQTQNGNINLLAANEVIVNGGAIRTVNGGNIGVTAENGDVNTGTDVSGYLFGQKVGSYYKVNAANLGGISTAAGGNVTINAGDNVISYLPVQTDWTDAQYDGGCGAFGPEPGNVTITAGGSVYGHYVLANGVGTITAGGDVGVPLIASDQNDGFALSLIKGSWSVYAPNGSIYVQDIDNPNGIFGEKAGESAANYAGYHYFDYDPYASVLLDAGDSVEITGQNAPQTPPSVLGLTSIPLILPPSFTVITGSGDFTLDTSVILFPSPDQNLNLTIGGNFVGNTFNLEMSDSAAKQWVDDSSFGTTDHGGTPLEVNNPNPVEISVAGNMQDVNLYTTKETQISVGGNIENCGFVGENLHASDVTSINVGGSIENSPLYSFESLSSAIISANSSQPGAWDSIFDLAVNPSMVSAITSFDANNATTVGPNGLAYYLQENHYLLFPSGTTATTTYGLNPGFVYDPNTEQLGFKGSMSSILSAAQISALESGSITVLVANSAGNPIIDSSGHLEVVTYTFNWGSTVAKLDTDSQGNTTTPGLGFQIGGPGQFNINAGYINLGNSPGIVSYGFGQGYGPNFASLESLCGTLDSGGAAVNVTVAGNLDMVTSRICSIDGGDVTVNAGGEINLSQGTFIFPVTDCYGIWTSGHSDVLVTANGNVNVGSARIATFNGGNVFVESYDGDVNCGTGANIALAVYGIYLDPSTGLPVSGTLGHLDSGSGQTDPPPYGSGILAEYPTANYQLPGGNGQPGNITVKTPNGNIVSGQGGIMQIALDASIGGGPTVTLIAGTPGVAATPDQGNILIGGIVIGGTINGTATGEVNGFFDSPHNVNLTGLSFTGVAVAGGNANINTSQEGIGPVTVVGIEGISAIGLGPIAVLLSQNVTGPGGTSQSTLGTSVSASAASQSAVQQANSQEQQQVAGTDTGDEDQKKNNKKPLIQRTGRVTVILSAAVPER